LKAGFRPLVSIIIPTYNSHRRLQQCLTSISRQTYQRIETLVVDRYSTDGTAREARKAGARVLFLDAERSEARNYGAENAAGDFVLFIDSDMLLTPTLVEECVQELCLRGLDAVVIPEQPVGKGRIAEWRTLEKRSLSNSGLGEIPRFFRKTAFLDIGGYDVKLVCGEDFDFHERFERRGRKTGKIRSTIFHVEGDLSPFRLLSKAYYYGKTFPALLKKNPRKTLRRYTCMRLASVRNAGKTQGDTASLLGLHTLKFLESAAYVGGILSHMVQGLSQKMATRRLAEALRKNKFTLANMTLIVLIATVIFRNFLFTTEWPGGGDVLGFVSRAYLYGKDFRWLYVWRQYSFGFVEGINFMDFFLMLLYSIFKDAACTVKAFMFGSYVIAGLSAYLFAHRFTHSEVGSMAASLVYILNQWLFSQLTEAHVDILFSYALAPLIFLLLDKALRSGKLRDILLLGTGFSLFVTSFHPESIVIYGVFLVMFAALFAVFPSTTVNIKARLARLLKVAATSVAIVSLFSAFVLLPFLMNVKSPYVQPSYEYPLEDSFSSSYQNLTDAFTLRAVERWGYINVIDVYSGQALPDFPIYTVLLWTFALAFCVLLFRRDLYTVFFAAAMLVSVFVAKGPYPPFGQVFVWAWFNIPYFAVFRAANRWVMMAVLADAFFVAILVSSLFRYVKSKEYARGDRFLRIRFEGNKLSKIRGFGVSVDAFNAVSKTFHRVLRALSILLLALIFLSGFIACFFFLQNGLQVYTPPQQILTPHEWLANIQNDCKIVSVSRGPGEWFGGNAYTSDFAFSAMQTTLGWGHDIGFDGSFIHDKPVMQDGGWDFKTRQFVDYLRFKLAREQLTNNLLNIVGPFAYEYVVIPAYSSRDSREFFLAQTGGHPVYNDTAIILKNEYAAPRLFAANNSAFVLGGLEAFDGLCKIDDFDLSKTLLYFAPSSLDKNIAQLETFNRSNLFCFANSDVLDLAMMSLHGEGEVIYAGGYGVPSLNTTAYWVRMPSWRRTGAFVLGTDTLTTSGKNRISIPFDARSDGEHDVWLRVGFAPFRGELTVSVDEEPAVKVHPEAPAWSKLDWVNVTRLNLTKGKHSITLKNDGTGYNDVDAISVTKPQRIESKINEAMTLLQSYGGKLLYLLEAENAFLDSTSNSWSAVAEPLVGYVIKSETLGINVASSAQASTSSVDDSLEARYAVDGDVQTRWASEKSVLPQWLELAWDRPQELQGVKIRFEDAYAVDYAVQTLNGSAWVNQTVARGNSELELTHCFTEPVKTVALRILVTATSIYDRVSIYEVDAYSAQNASSTAKITVPRRGNYTIAAGVGVGPEFGTMFFGVNDAIQRVECNASARQFEWREIGTFCFEVGEQTLSVGGAGLAELDELLVYSQDEGVSHGLNSLFESADPPVSLEYERKDPCTYDVRVTADEPFVLVFSETYDPFWRAFVGQEEIASNRAYSMVNSFHVDRTGSFTVTITFAGQRYADAGIGVSIASFFSIWTAVLTSGAVSRWYRLQKKRLTVAQ